MKWKDTARFPLCPLLPHRLVTISAHTTWHRIRPGLEEPNHLVSRATNFSAKSELNSFQMGFTFFSSSNKRNKKKKRKEKDLNKGHPDPEVLCCSCNFDRQTHHLARSLISHHCPLPGPKFLCAMSLSGPAVWEGADAVALFKYVSLLKLF